MCPSCSADFRFSPGCHVPVRNGKLKQSGLSLPRSVGCLVGFKSISYDHGYSSCAASLPEAIYLNEAQPHIPAEVS